jgi:hypothetical protein
MVGLPSTAYLTYLQATPSKGRKSTTMYWLRLSSQHMQPLSEVRDLIIRGDRLHVSSGFQSFSRARLGKILDIPPGRAARVSRHAARASKLLRPPLRKLIGVSSPCSTISHSETLLYPPRRSKSSDLGLLIVHHPTLTSSIRCIPTACKLLDKL